MSKTLETMGVLTQVDGAAFAGYWQAYARWKEAEEFLSKHGTIFKTPSGYIQQVPQVSIAQTYLKVYEVHQKAEDILRGKKQDPIQYSNEKIRYEIDNIEKLIQ